MSMISFQRRPVTMVLLLLIAGVMAMEVRDGALVNGEVLRKMGAITNDLFATGQVRRLLTGMFLHGSMLHWLTNSWALLQLGGLFEEMFGSWRLLFVYFTTGIAASIVSAMHLGPHGMSVGASGAIFGIMGALLTAIHRSSYWREHPVSKSLRRQLLFWAGLNLLLGFMVPVIDNAAHIAGLVAGLAAGLVRGQVEK